MYGVARTIVAILGDPSVRTRGRRVPTKIEGGHHVGQSEARQIHGGEWDIVLQKQADNSTCFSIDSTSSSRIPFVTHWGSFRQKEDSPTGGG